MNCLCSFVESFMKSLVSLLFFLSSIFVFAQDFKLHVLKLNLLDSIATEKVIDSLPIVDIKAEHWDTNVYNPYKNEVVKFPVQLKFNDSNYTSPITINKVITSRYGWRHGRAHKGIDIDLVTGDSVVAMFDGIVRFAYYNTGHGRTVIVRHYNGLETVYAHLSKYAVKVNDTVMQGQLLGKGGTTGNARGSHLHLVVNYKGVSINPEYLFEFTEKNAIRSKEIWVTKQWTRPYAHNSRRQSHIRPLITKEDAIASLEKEKKIYIVKRGDTLSKISLRNNVSIAALCKINAIKKASLLRIGQKLIIQ